MIAGALLFMPIVGVNFCRFFTGAFVLVVVFVVVVVVVVVCEIVDSTVATADTSNAGVDLIFIEGVATAGILALIAVFAAVS